MCLWEAASNALAGGPSGALDGHGRMRAALQRKREGAALRLEAKLRSRAGQRGLTVTQARMITCDSDMRFCVSGPALSQNLHSPCAKMRRLSALAAPLAPRLTIARQFGFYVSEKRPVLRSRLKRVEDDDAARSPSQPRPRLQHPT